jgi:hypothetical protein
MTNISSKISSLLTVTAVVAGFVGCGRQDEDIVERRGCGPDRTLAAGQVNARHSIRLSFNSYDERLGNYGDKRAEIPLWLRAKIINRRVVLQMVALKEGYEEEIWKADPFTSDTYKPTNQGYEQGIATAEQQNRWRQKGLSPAAISFDVEADHAIAFNLIGAPIITSLAAVDREAASTMFVSICDVASR